MARITAGKSHCLLLILTQHGPLECSGEIKLFAVYKFGAVLSSSVLTRYGPLKYSSEIKRFAAHVFVRCCAPVRFDTVWSIGVFRRDQAFCGLPSWRVAELHLVLTQHDPLEYSCEIKLFVNHKVGSVLSFSRF